MGFLRKLNFGLSNLVFILLQRGEAHGQHRRRRRGGRDVPRHRPRELQPPHRQPRGHQNPLRRPPREEEDVSICPV